APAAVSAVAVPAAVPATIASAGWQGEDRGDRGRGRRGARPRGGRDHRVLGSRIPRGGRRRTARGRGRRGRHQRPRHRRTAGTPVYRVAADAARPVPQDVGDGISGRDTAALQELTCDDAADYVTSTIDDLEGRFPGQTTLEQFDETPDDAKALVRAAVDESGYT